MTTGAENAGHVDAYERAQSKGIEIKQMWLATLDGRTRDSHREMDGETVEVGGTFSNGCRFPGDPSGPAEEVWNCRCRVISQIKGFEIDPTDPTVRRSDKLDGMTYEEWREAHGVSEPIEKPDEIAKRMRYAYGAEYRKGVKGEEAGEGEQRSVTLNTPGNAGEKAAPYSERGIDIGARYKNMLDRLQNEGDIIKGPKGEYTVEDLSVLSHETGVEYTLISVEKESRILRGNERYTTIPKPLYKEMIEKHGTIDGHSRPYIGDLMPSENDKFEVGLLTWQKESVIIDPTVKR